MLCRTLWWHEKAAMPESWKGQVGSKYHGWKYCGFFSHNLNTPAGLSDQVWRRGAWQETPHLVALSCSMCQMKKYPRICFRMVTGLEIRHITWSVGKNTPNWYWEGRSPSRFFLQSPHWGKWITPLSYLVFEESTVPIILWDSCVVMPSLSAWTCTANELMGEEFEAVFQVVILCGIDPCNWWGYLRLQEWCCVSYWANVFTDVGRTIYI